MNRKLFAATLFAVACAAMMYASTAEAVDEAPAPRPAAGGEGDKKPDAKGKFGGFGGGKFGGFGGGKIDPDKLKAFQEKFGGKGGFGGGKFDPAKFKEMKGKFGGKGGFGKKKDGNKEE
jgi:hypothetical protein